MQMPRIGNDGGWRRHRMLLALAALNVQTPETESAVRVQEIMNTMQPEPPANGVGPGARRAATKEAQSWEVLAQLCKVCANIRSSDRHRAIASMVLYTSLQCYLTKKEILCNDVLYSRFCI